MERPEMVGVATNIDRQLRDAGMDTVVIVGTLTNVCCESSARDAMMLNYRLLFVSDANATLSDAEHNATLATILRVFGDVVTTEEVVTLLSTQSREQAA
jgi:ureidoacrylate peracid hydrolase